MRNRTIKMFSLFAALSVCFAGKQAQAYNTPTHERITAFAAQNASYIPDSLDTVYTDSSGCKKTVLQWMQYGAVQEDNEYLTRPLHHFYNVYTKAGLTDTKPYSSLSLVKPSYCNSLEWAWNDPDNNYSWTMARQYQFLAITSAKKVDRDNYTTMMYRSLGQVMHLLQDAAQPQHTRNDAHTLKVIGGTGAPYEDWCEDPLNTPDSMFISYYSSYLAPEPLPMPQYDDHIPVEFRTLWDSGQYMQAAGSIPEDTGNFQFEDGYGTPYYTVGLAEFSNMYFCTNQTMFTGQEKKSIISLGASNAAHLIMDHIYHLNDLHYFPYPSLDAPLQAITSITAPAFQPINFSKPLPVIRAGNNIGANFTSGGWLTYLNADPLSPAYYPAYYNLHPHNSFPNQPPPPPSLSIGVDNATYTSMASILLPMAVDMSTQLLEYFFRADVWPGPVAFDEVKQNFSTQVGLYTSGDTSKNGNWQVYGEKPDGTREAQNITVSAGASFDQFVINFPPSLAYSQYEIVYKGDIGDEKAVGIGDTSWVDFAFGGTITIPYTYYDFNYGLEDFTDATEIQIGFRPQLITNSWVQSGYVDAVPNNGTSYYGSNHPGFNGFDNPFTYMANGSQIIAMPVAGEDNTVPINLVVHWDTSPPTLTGTIRLQYVVDDDLGLHTEDTDCPFTLPLVQ